MPKPLAVSAARGARARAREQITHEVVQTARRHLATHGAAGLSLRAVARDLGMVSSAVYRYVPSRDALLTLLLTQAYNSLGEAAEQAESGVRRSARRRRFLVTCRAVRSWAARHPAEWALLYGSPVPGYAAPPDTVGPATRVPRLLLAQVADVVAAGPLDAGLGRPLGGRLGAAIDPVRVFAAAELDGRASLPDEMVLRAVMTWTYLVGAVSFELGGHLVGSVGDHDTYFDAAVARMADFTGLR